MWETVHKSKQKLTPDTRQFPRRLCCCAPSQMCPWCDRTTPLHSEATTNTCKGVAWEVERRMAFLSLHMQEVPTESQSRQCRPHGKEGRWASAGRKPVIQHLIGILGREQPGLKNSCFQVQLENVNETYFFLKKKHKFVYINRNKNRLQVSKSQENFKSH